MSELETSQDKVKKICDVLRKETLDPARKEAQKILDDAEKQKQEILIKAKEESGLLLQQAQKKIEEERGIFEASLHMAGKQVVLSLKQEIEERLFNPILKKKVEEAASRPELIAEIIQALIKGIEKEGIFSKLSLELPDSINPEVINTQLAQEVIESLKEVSLTSIKGGAKVRIIDQNLSLEMDSEALTDLLKNYIAEDLQKFLYG
ncbi:MAG: V-type ATP synthase subunit E [Simkaniaceae bacterium]